MPGSVQWRVNKPKPQSPTQQMFEPTGEDDDEELVLSRMPVSQGSKPLGTTMWKVGKVHLVGVQDADIVDGQKTLVEVIFFTLWATGLRAPLARNTQL